MPTPFEVYADGPDLFQIFFIPGDVPSGRIVAAVELHPGHKRAVHHAVLFLDSNGAARKLDKAMSGPGFVPTRALGSWSVGNTPRRNPGGMRRLLTKGSDRVMQIHDHPTGKTEVDRAEVDLCVIEEPVAEGDGRNAERRL